MVTHCSEVNEAVLKFLKFFMAFLAMAGLCGPALSQNVSDHATSGPPASWVIVNEVPSAPFDLADETNVQYLLVDQQRRVSSTSSAYYRHYADRLPSARAVENNSTITINLDPAYQSVVLHRVQIRRDGEVIDLLDLSAFDIYREETDREKLIYNGRLQMAYVVPGVRVGDVLEYAYTVNGRNPAIGPHFFGGFRHQYGVPVQKLYQRYSHPEGTDVSVKTYHSPVPPVTSSVDGYATHTWDLNNVEGKETDSNLPEGYERYSLTEYSSFADWAEVGAYFHPFYDAAQFQTDKVQAVAAEIRASTADRSEQLRAALDYVQQEVRYLGIELGPGGYVPRDPDLVLDRRFGDCKDMVVLLTAILKALNIEAYPLLVDFDYREQVAEQIPSYAAFDHVVALAKLNGKSYFLDPTRGPQLGDLQNLQQADFGRGVVIAADGPGMIKAIAPTTGWQKDIVDKYDLTDPEVATFTTTNVFRTEAADRMLSRRDRNGLQEIDDGYFKFYQRSYPSIERDGPLALEVDQDAGTVTVTASYRIPDYWQLDEDSGEETFDFTADEIGSATPTIERSERSGPYALAYPTAIRQKLVLITEDDFGYGKTSDLQTVPGLAFRNSLFLNGGRYEHEFTYRVTRSQIAAVDVPQHMQLVETVDEEIWRSYTRPAAAIWGTTAEEAPLFLFALAILGSLLVATLHRNKDADDRKHQLLYPVGTFKFVVLSLVSLGLYQAYWVYKNWVWIRDVKGESIWPFWRAVFMNFTNFSLFPRIVKEAPAASFPLPVLAPIYAIIYMIFSVADYSADTPGIGTEFTSWFGFAAILIFVPMSREVLRKNAANGKYVTRNSAFGWPAIALLVMCLPMFVTQVVALASFLP